MGNPKQHGHQLVANQIGVCTSSLRGDVCAWIEKSVQKICGQRQLEVGLSQIAFFSKDNPVLSPLADVFESNLNNIRDKNTKESQSNVDLMQSNAARGNAR